MSRILTVTNAVFIPPVYHRGLWRSIKKHARAACARAKKNRAAAPGITTIPGSSGSRLQQFPDSGGDVFGRYAKTLDQLPGLTGLPEAICDTDNVERLVRQVSDRELHVLPVEIGDLACFRICWGPFRSRSRAVAAADELPAPLRSLSENPQPRLAASLIP